VNSVSLIGQLTVDPELRTNRAGIDECRMRIAVQRRQRGGQAEPGVVYIDLITFGFEARDCAARLVAGDRLGLSGRLEPEAGKHVLVDQLDFL
jgi:single-stranded DNA-binding protein